MNKIFKTFALLAVAGLAFIACDPSEKIDPEGLSDNEMSLKAAVEEYIPNVVYKTYGNLADATENLFNQLAALDYSSITDAQIQAVCNTFLSARSYWEASEAFLYGAATAYGIDPHIDSWPLDKDKLAKELSNATVIADLEEEGADAVDEVGVANLGFHGIEFILFRDGAPRSAAALKAAETDEAFEGLNVTGKEELIFAKAVAEDLRNYTWELQCAWDPDAPESRRALVEDDLEMNTTLESGYTYGENMLKSGEAGSTMASWQRAVSTILVAGCSNICNEVANSKIASAHTAEDPDYIESPYSKNSYTDFLNNTLSIVNSLYGSYNASSPSATSIMTFLKGNYSGYSAFESALNNAVNALKACVNSDVAFVDDPAAACAGNAIDALNSLDNELNKAAEYIETL